MESISRLLQAPHRRSGEGKTSERGELIVWMRDQLNVANRRDNRREVTAAEVAKRVQGIPTKDLGRDLYYLKGQMEEALDRGFPVGASFYTASKRMREGIKVRLQQL